MKPVPGWFRVLCYVMAVNFAGWVALQYNDPDPIRWMAIYGGTMVVSALLPTKKQLVPVAFLIALTAAVWALILLVGIWGKMGFSDLWLKMSEKGGAVEEGRECGGLAIDAVWLLVAGWLRSRRA